MDPPDPVHPRREKGSRDVTIIPPAERERTAHALRSAAALIERWGLSRIDYEDGVTGELDPSGAIAYALGMRPSIWSSTDWTEKETAAWQTGEWALRALFDGIGRWDAAGPDMDAEDLANHIAFWLTDPDAPSDEQVLAVMERVADSLAVARPVSPRRAA